MKTGFFGAHATKPLIYGIGFALFAYLVVAPIAWRPPTVEADIPASASLREDLVIPVRLKAWHGNMDVASIRFYVDFYATTAKGTEGLFNPVIIFEQRPRMILSSWSIERFTYPRTLVLNVTVPLRDFAEKGLLGPGTLVGKVDVNYVYCVPSPGKSIPGVDRMRPGMKSVPFSITVNN